MYVWCLRVFDAAPFTSETMTPRSACFTGFASSCLVNRFAWMAGVLHLNQSWCSMLTAETLFNQQALPWETICLNEMWIRMIWKSWTLIMLFGNAQCTILHLLFCFHSRALQPANVPFPAAQESKNSSKRLQRSMYIGCSTDFVLIMIRKCSTCSLDWVFS